MGRMGPYVMSNVAVTSQVAGDSRVPGDAGAHGFVVDFGRSLRRGLAKKGGSGASER